MGIEKELSKRRRGHECPICNQKDDTTEHVLDRVSNSRNSSYRINKKTIPYILFHDIQAPGLHAIQY